ncbi:beta-ketoacyl synthase N-terminal-like domain-containing protein [Amycolatopsis sp. Hca4]|uniref:beta-ketoacyl synthase N-terminal-like domain-containing protein n=1 Tax=Amycolatopsis sp. Hca4 TaxID=2742131 RepID=UPI00159048EA|nr:beta-ketoacyl synthase N-terminal-like domain-containing protein [Amycolatopsis sp. Hca4]QKV80357.1 KR domain-containing protein [Amycolatopsis sp. Hca4]
MNQQYERPGADAVRRAEVGGLAFAPRWSTGALPAAAPRPGGTRVFLVPPGQEALRRELTEAFPHEDVVALRDPLTVPPDGAHLVFVSRTSWSDGVRDDDLTALLRLVRALDSRPAVTLDVVTDKAVPSPLFPAAGHPVDGVHVGLARTLAAERPEWRVRCLCLSDLSASTLDRALGLALPDAPGKALCLDGDRIATAGMAPVRLGEWPSRPAFRTGGTYVILGGTGGLGGVLAEYLAEHYRAEIVLLGRRGPEHTEAARRRLGELGARAVHHHQADLADGAALRAALDRHDVVHGVIHSALVLDDATLATMSDRRLLDVLRPKVHGTHQLVQALRGRELDFCLFFSSLQSYLANAGQGNYAAASVAADSYADLIREALLIDARVVNWGYWGSVGIVAKPEYRERMRRLGVGSLEPAEGLAVVERLLAGEHRQITVVKATPEALQRMDITPHETAAETSGPAALVPPFADDTPEATRNRALAERIEAYARSALHRTDLPSVAIPRHARLLSAVRAIPDAPSPSRAELVREYPDLAGHLTLLDRCVESLPAVLRGDLDPLEVVFPGGSFELVAPVYRSNPIADHFNGVSADVVAAYQRQVSGRELRILEIGAGTGSTTRFVLDRLDPHDVSYAFTDLSHAFLNRARDAFAEHPYLRFEICDVTDPPPAYEGRFDVVVATNVLHATPDVPTTLRNVRRMLRDGGILVLGEITARQDYATLTFGLTDGWWLGNDAYRLEHSPLLSGTQWRRLLAEAGFGDVASHGGDEQQVLVAAAGPAASPAHPAPDGVGLTERVEGFVRGVIAETMRFEVSEVERDRPFRDMGIDSLIAMELLKPLREVVGYLPATVLFEFPTVARLAGHLVSEHGEVLSEAFPGEPEEPARPGSDGVGLTERVEGFVRGVIAETMRFEVSEVERDRPFRDMGIDSLIAMELLKPLREVVGYLPATVLFEFPTVARLAGHLVSEHGEVLSEAFPGEPEEPARPGSDGVGLTERVEGFVRGVIAETMRFEVSEVERDRPFRDMGIDSLIAMELLKPLREVVGYLPATVLFEFPTVARLAEHLVSEHRAALEGEFDGGPAAEPVAEAETRDELAVRDGDVAVIGMSARLPGARTVDEFWANLVAGVDATSEVPSGRWKVDVTAGPEPLSYTGRGAFIDDVDAFDHTFFTLTPRDAAVMDPQERLVLEQTYQALLDAGYSRAGLAGGDTGVFVGVMNGGYAWHTPADPAEPPTTSLFWSMANRTSYHFDWHGPSLAVDTACSASLTALHLACQSLRTGECRQAVVSGVNLITHPRQFRLLSGMGMLSRGGTCRPFGEGADGFVDGEGVVCLVLKPLADARRDGDRVHAVIAGSAINAGGRANGYTAPNVDAQHALITRALSAAGIPPEGVGYVEAHGTGTELGDPIEVRALGKAYAAAGTERIRLGSVKAGIGHLESAAGLAGVLKAVLQMRHRKLVPSLHADRTNPHIDFPATPFVLNTQPAEWPDPLPLVSAVSSFGAGGANAHVVLRGVPAQDPAPPRPERDCYVIPLSHHSSAGLQLLMDDLRASLLGRRVDMDALAHTLSCRRDAFRHRVALVCRDQDDLVRQLGVDLQRRGARTPSGPAGVLTADTAPAVAAFFESGGDPGWDGFYPPRPPVSLPGYPFLRHRHWVASVESDLGGLGELVAAHRIGGEAVAPAAWSLSVLSRHAGGKTLGHVLWQRPVTDPGAVEVVTRGRELSLVDNKGGDPFCTAEVVDPGDARPFATAPAEGGRRLDGEEVYARFRELGYDYGPALRGVRWAEVAPGAVRAFLHVDRDWGFELSPALLDAGMQLSILLSASDDPAAPVFVPYHLGRLKVVRAPRDEAVFCECTERAGGSARTRTFDFRFTDVDGNPLVLLEEAVSVAAGGAPAPRRAPSAFEVFELS